MEFPLLEQRKLPNLQKELVNAFVILTEIDEQGIYVFTQNLQQTVSTGGRRQSVMADRKTVISYRNILRFIFLFFFFNF